MDWPISWQKVKDNGEDAAERLEQLSSKEIPDVPDSTKNYQLKSEAGALKWVLDEETPILDLSDIQIYYGGGTNITDASKRAVLEKCASGWKNVVCKVKYVDPVNSDIYHTDILPMTLSSIGNDKEYIAPLIRFPSYYVQISPNGLYWSGRIMSLA